MPLSTDGWRKPVAFEEQNSDRSGHKPNNAYRRQPFAGGPKEKNRIESRCNERSDVTISITNARLMWFSNKQPYRLQLLEPWVRASQL